MQIKLNLPLIMRKCDISLLCLVYSSGLLTRHWFPIGLQAQARLPHLNMNEASFFASLLWLDAATRPYYAFSVQVEKALEDIFCIFRWSQSSLTYDSCGPHS